MDCERCDGGTLEQQESGFFLCDTCSATVSPGNIREPGTASILGD